MAINSLTWVVVSDLYNFDIIPCCPLVPYPRLASSTPELRSSLSSFVPEQGIRNTTFFNLSANSHQNAIMYFTLLYKLPVMLHSTSTSVTVKFRKISPRAYIFQRPFLRGLFLEGLIYGGKFAFQNRLG